MAHKLFSAPSSKYEYFVKSCIAGITYSVIVLMFIIIASILNITSHSLDLFASLVLGFLGGLSLSLVLGYVSVNFPYPKTVRFALIFAILFIIGYLSNIVEYIFFSTTALGELYYEIAYMMIAHIVTASVIVHLFPPTQMSSSLSEILKDFLSAHTLPWWALRIFIAGALYLPIYFFFGALFSPIIIPFYTDPSYGLELIIPPFEIIVPLEIARGVVYVILLIPVIASVNLDRRKQSLLLAMILFCVGALPGLLANQMWPVLLRLAHGLEIAADSLVYGYVILKIIKRHKTQ